MYSTDIGQAAAFAEKAYEGLVDKAGAPLLEHARRVASGVNLRVEGSAGDECLVVALLHDVVEEGRADLDTIGRLFGSDTAAAVDAVSRREGESWQAYIRRVKGNPVGRIVKISDLVDNSNLSRLGVTGNSYKITVEDAKRQLRYAKALVTLLEDD